ncbi:hypothetical protein [Pediococcus parvulus]|uniref:hypothetical protein n=1 Tax=Pediococcus parvulus TaxID=54062 RepID=UPI00345E1EBC
MRKKIDIVTAYISIILILLTPLYYVFSLAVQLANFAPNELILLSFSLIIDIILVLKIFKIYYK